MLNERWADVVQSVDFALQPIVNIYTGKLYALEALIRGYEKVGFHSIDALFDAAFNEKVLYSLDIRLREKAIYKFSQLSCSKYIKLFYNLDNRITLMPDFQSGYTCDLLKAFGMQTDNLCFELSEKHQVGYYAGIDKIVLNLYKQQGYKMAIDDFGVGFSGLQMLYNADPHFIKIDRFFISDIHRNRKKRLFLSSIIQIAQAMGIFTIAEGVESEAEYLECKRLGCNLVQGYFIQHPTCVLEEILPSYPMLKEISNNEKRSGRKINHIEKYIQNIDALSYTANIDTVYSMLKEHQHANFVPVITDDGIPLGIIRDKDIKAYVYSTYGRSLLYNLTQGNLNNVISPCACADINDSLEKILKLYTFDGENDCILITENERYMGYLSSKTLLEIINEKSIIDAKDQNPLTGLSGNRIINEFVSQSIDAHAKVIMVHFDFDNFKPFNDYYGFRIGDRAITLFADILKSTVGFQECLIGHVGGDDFFLGWELQEEESFEKIYTLILAMIEKFSNDIKSFYSEKSMNDGYIVVKNRQGILQQFSFMTISAAIICNGFGYFNTYDDDYVNELFSLLKKSAKASPTHTACVDLGVFKEITRA